MTANDYTGMPGNENITIPGMLVLIVVAVAVGAVVWGVAEFQRMRAEKRDVDSLLAREFHSATRRCSSRFCGAVIEPGEGRNGLCGDCAHRTYGSAS